jgi:hypothetical protein
MLNFPVLTSRVLLEVIVSELLYDLILLLLSKNCDLVRDVLHPWMLEDL